MLVDDIGDVTITKDGATILKMLEDEHPAAKVDKLSIFFCTFECLLNFCCVYYNLYFLSLYLTGLPFGVYRCLWNWLSFKTEKLEMALLQWS